MRIDPRNGRRLINNFWHRMGIKPAIPRGLHTSHQAVKPVRMAFIDLGGHDTAHDCASMLFAKAVIFKHSKAQLFGVFDCQCDGFLHRSDVPSRQTVLCFID